MHGCDVPKYYIVTVFRHLEPVHISRLADGVGGGSGGVGGAAYGGGLVGNNSGTILASYNNNVDILDFVTVTAGRGGDGATGVPGAAGGTDAIGGSGGNFRQVTGAFTTEFCHAWSFKGKGRIGCWKN